MKLDFNTVIIGAGPAGMAAAIYLKRSNVSFIIIEKDAPGGQMLRTSRIENYPGFKNISGADLSFNMCNQLKELGIDIKHDTVLDIELIDDKKRVKTKGCEYTCDNIIIATGKAVKSLGLPLEEKLINKGISYCATCDGSLYKDMTVAVVGGGSSALEDSLYLSDIAKKVILLCRKPAFKGEDILIKEVESKENIDVRYETSIKELLDNNDKLSGLITSTNEKLDVSALFVCIGSVPVNMFTSKLNIEMDNNYIIVDEKFETNIKGIYAVGDVIKKDFYQIINASSEGALAAMYIKKNIKK